jgi:hypothetical protein
LTASTKGEGVAWLRVIGTLVVAGVIGAFGACTADERFPSVSLDGDGMLPPTIERCTDGTTRACGITLGEHAGVLTCYQGTQLCVGERWAECGDGEVVAGPGTGTERTAATPFPSVGFQAVTGSVDCEANPCDPYCRTFDQRPDASIEPEVTERVPRFTWQGGTLASFPGGLVNMGLKQPCFSALDCQFNMRCENVATAPACSHDKCEVGEAYSAACVSQDMCVKLICTAHPECCGGEATLGDACVPGICEFGFDAVGCTKYSECVDAVCAADPTCCDVTWDAVCIDMALSLGADSACPTSCQCPPGATLGGDGATCRMSSVNMATPAANRETARAECQGVGAGWDLAKIESANENLESRGVAGGETWIGLWDPPPGTANALVWADGTPLGPYQAFVNPEPRHVRNPGAVQQDCTFLNPSNGRWFMGQCSTLREYLCEGPAGDPPDEPGEPDAGAGAGADDFDWDAACVGYVEDVCGAYCGQAPGAGGVAGEPGSGTCVEWAPGERTDCPTAELTVGPGCGAGIPICNIGNATAPAGVLVISFPANSGHLDKYRTTLTISDFNNYGECYTDEEIPPGQCINFECPDSLSGNNKELMVNPPTSRDGTYVPIPECFQYNNWSIWRSGGCSPPSCHSFTDTDPIACSHLLPTDTSRLDLDAIVLTVAARQGTTFDDGTTHRELTHVSDASACTGTDGFYVDPDTNSIVICQDACDAYVELRADLYGNVDCPIDPVYAVHEFTETYQTSCDSAETRTQWGYFAFDATAPAGTLIDFSMRTAGTEAGLTDVEWTQVATVSDAADAHPATCPMSGPSPCPVDLFVELGGLPTAGQPFLELRATLNPSSGVPSAAPSIHGWEVTYSCPPDR